jgi:hypothetical protein
MSEQQTIDQRVAEIDRETEECVESVGGRDRISEDRELWRRYCEIRMQEHGVIESVFPPPIPRELGELFELVDRLKADN